MKILRFNSHPYSNFRYLVLVVFVTLALGGCGASNTATPVEIISTAGATAAAPTVTPTPSPTLTASAVPTPTASLSPTPSPTVTETPSPTPEPVMGAISVSQAVLVSGPGQEYTFLGQFSEGFLLELVGRDDTGEWLVVLLVGGAVAWIEAAQVATDVDINLLPSYDRPPVPPPTNTPEPVPMVVLSSHEGNPGIEFNLTYSGFTPGLDVFLIITNLATGESSDHKTQLPEVGGNGTSTIKLDTRADTEPGQYLFTVYGSDGKEASAIFTVLEPGS